MTQLKQEERIIKQNTIFTMIVNIFLAAIKLASGILGSSLVLITDAINSIGDVLTNVIIYISSIFSKREIDSDHPYGHEKIDSIISIFVGIVIIYTAYEVGSQAVILLINMIKGEAVVEVPKWFALAAALLTIVVKELLYRKTIRDSKKANSSALKAQALDHRSDTYASFGASIAIIAAMLGFGFLDPIVSIIIAILILKLGIEVILAGVNQVVDKAASPEITEQIKKIISKYEEVRSIDDIKTRMFAMKVYVDLEIGLDYSLTLEESHAIAEQIHEDIENTISDVLHCMIHVNPYYSKDELTD